MNSQFDSNASPEPASLQNETLLEVAPEPPPRPQNGDPADPPSPDNSSRRPRGKVARLPKAIRDPLNFMLRDGVAHVDIIDKLGETAKDLTPRNISNWHRGAGYQRWEKDQEWLEDLRAEQEAGLDLIPDFDTGRFNEAALQVAVTHLFRAFRHLSSGGL